MTNIDAVQEDVITCRLYKHISKLPALMRLVSEHVPALLDEVESWRKKHGATYCAYCGERYVIDAPDSVEAITNHIYECKKHPMAALRKRLDKAKGALEAVVWEYGANDNEKAHANLDCECFLRATKRACKALGKPWGYWREKSGQTDRDRGGEVNRPCPK